VDDSGCAKGVGVGYGQTWTSNRDTRVGLVPVGYGMDICGRFGIRAKMIRGRARVEMSWAGEHGITR